MIILKKGFTLVELMAIIIILGLLAMITVPVVNSTIKNTKEKSYKAQISLIIEAANKWGVKNVDKLPVADEKVYVKVSELISSGFLENSVNGKLLDPRDNSEINGCVIIQYIMEYNQYSYVYSNTCN